MDQVYKNFEGYDRFDFPDGIYRVTAGKGGESYLIDGGEKVALYDCGMAFCSRGLIENIEKVLKSIGREKPDAILVSHTHYDHIGALPYIIEKWPDITVYGAEKVKEVFQSEGAIATMERLGTAARDKFGGEEYRDAHITARGMRIDKVVSEGDVIDLGKRKIMVYETKGHTDCSLSFLLLPDRILFASESTGVLRTKGMMHTAILKDYDQCIESAEKCRNLRPSLIIGNHYGVVPAFYTDQYFTEFVKSAEEEKKYIMDLAHKGLSFDQILQGVKDKYWTEDRAKAQPLEAFMENAKYSTKVILDRFAR